MTDTPVIEDHPQSPSQEEMPFAMVYGEAVTELPKDLYIPPEALEVILEAFEGPLDLLLYLIKRQNIDILQINVAEITRQYMAYIELMEAMHFELAAEYLLMAAMLAEIKSRMLLPRQEELEDEDDPRAELIRRLQEYERFKRAAEDIDELPRVGRDTFIASAKEPDRSCERPHPEVSMQELLVALSEVMRRAEMFESHQVQRELSVYPGAHDGSIRAPQRAAVCALCQPVYCPRGPRGRGNHLSGGDGADQGVTGGNRPERNLWPHTCKSPLGLINELSF